MRRITAGSVAFLLVTGGLLVLPVYAAPGPEAEPVDVTAEEVALGSLQAPAPAAEVRTGTTEPVSGVTGTAPVLTVRETEVDEFSMVSVNWTHDPAVTDTVVNVRVQGEDGGWGDWTEVGTEDAEPDPGANPGTVVRGGSSPLWTGPSTGVEVEVVTRSGATPTDVQLDLIDPGESAADAALGSPDIQDTADAAMAMPPVYSRAQWGANPDYMTWTPQQAGTIKGATVHHTASGNTYAPDDVPAILRGIYYAHAVSNGWGDIGYNVIADKYGRLWEGRTGGLASTVIGAHAAGFNTYTFGVSMLGNYDVVQPAQTMLDALADIIAWKFSLYGVDPRGTAQLTSGGTDLYAAGKQVTLPAVFAHRDTKKTACPGQYGYARMGDIRARVAAQVDLSLTAIEKRYVSDAGLRSWLGAEVGEERYGAGFAWREYEHGRLYWSAETGVRFLRGDILAAFLAAGGPGALGVPVADEGVAGSWGAYSHFTNDASIYWTVQTGAQVVRGAVRARWLAMGAEWGPLGFPTAGEVGVEGGAVKAAFAGGEIYWSAATGAFDVRGGIGQAWRAGGGLTRFGLPTAGEVAVAGGAVTQEFARGYTWVWSAAGTRLVAGGIREAWLGQGGAAGPLGLPLTDEGDTPAGGGRFSEFAGGTVVWTPSAGAVVLSGAIGARWVAAGGLGSGLGLPTAALRATADGRGQVVPFASGAGIYQATGSGSAFLVRGGVGDRWAAMGGPAGLGLPVTEETVLQRGSGVYQVFAKGKIMWSAATGAHPVYGAIGAAYDALGAEWSRLGLPTRGEYAVPGGVRADFESGSITWNATTGATTVTYR